MPTLLKRIFRLFLLAGSLGLYSAACERDYQVRADFYYLNTSPFDVVVRRYNARKGTEMTLVEEFRISSMAEYKASVTSMGPANMSCDDFRSAVLADSLSISYSNGSHSSFSLLDSVSSNPMLMGNYSSQKLGENYCEFRFTIN